jgi:hypothetical protein
MPGQLAETREKLNGTNGALITAILVMALVYFAREVFISPRSGWTISLSTQVLH